MRKVLFTLSMLSVFLLGMFSSVAWATDKAPSTQGSSGPTPSLLPDGEGAAETVSITLNAQTTGAATLHYGAGFNQVYNANASSPVSVEKGKPVRIHWEKASDGGDVIIDYIQLGEPETSRVTHEQLQQAGKNLTKDYYEYTPTEDITIYVAFRAPLPAPAPKLIVTFLDQGVKEVYAKTYKGDIVVKPGEAFPNNDPDLQFDIYVVPAEGYDIQKIVAWDRFRYRFERKPNNRIDKGVYVRLEKDGTVRLRNYQPYNADGKDATLEITTIPKKYQLILETDKEQGEVIVSDSQNHNQLYDGGAKDIPHNSKLRITAKPKEGSKLKEINVYSLWKPEAEQKRQYTADMLTLSEGTYELPQTESIVGNVRIEVVFERLQALKYTISFTPNSEEGQVLVSYTNPEGERVEDHNLSPIEVKQGTPISVWYSATRKSSTNTYYVVQSISLGQTVMDQAAILAANTDDNTLESGTVTLTPIQDGDLVVTFVRDPNPPAPKFAVIKKVTPAGSGNIRVEKEDDPDTVYDEENKFKSGTSLKVIVTPNGNYDISKVIVTVKGKEAETFEGEALALVGRKFIKTFAAVDNELTVEATFAAKDIKHTLIIEPTSNGNVQVRATDDLPSGAQVATGTVLTISVTPNAGYEVESIKLNDADKTLDFTKLESGVMTMQYTLNLDLTIKATFRVANTSGYTVTYTQPGVYGELWVKDATGTIDIESGTTMNTGEKIMIYVQLSRNTHRLIKVKVGKTEFLPENALEGSSSMLYKFEYTVNSHVAIEAEIITIRKYQLTVQHNPSQVSYSLFDSETNNKIYSYDGIISELTPVKIEITPNPGYELLSAQVDDNEPILAGEMTVSGNSASFVIGKLTKNTLVKLNSRAKSGAEFALSIQNATPERGSVEVKQDGMALVNKIVAGKPVEIKVTPTAGNQLVTLKINDIPVEPVLVGNSYTYAINEVEGSTTVAVEFDEASATVLRLKYIYNKDHFDTSSWMCFKVANQNGTTLASGDRIRSGDKIKFSLVLKPNARLHDITVDGVSAMDQLTDHSYFDYIKYLELTVAEADLNVVITTEPVVLHPVSIELNNYQAGYVTVSNGNSTFDEYKPIPHGTEVTISAEERLANYELETLQINEEAPIRKADLNVVEGKYFQTVHTVDGPLAIKAIYKRVMPKMCDVQVSWHPLEWGNVAIRNQQNEKVGDTTTPGSITAKITKGERVTFAIQAQEGYKVLSLQINGQEKIPTQIGNAYSYIYKVEGNTEVNITFSLDQKNHSYALINDETKGTVMTRTDETNYNPGDMIPENTEITFSIEPKKGYKLASISLNDTQILADELERLGAAYMYKYTVTEDFTLTVKYLTQEFFNFSLNNDAEKGDVTVQNQAGVTITGDTKPEKGDKLTVTISPKGDFKLEAIENNGTRIPVAELTANGNSFVYTIDDVQADITLTTFYKEEKMVVVTIPTSDEGQVSVTVDGKPVKNGEKVLVGADAVITVTPSAGKEVAEVTIGGKTYRPGDQGWKKDANGVVTISTKVGDKMDIAVKYATDSRRLGGQHLSVRLAEHGNLLLIEGVSAGTIVEVYDITGKLRMATTDRRIDFSHMPAGAYIVRMGNHVVKFVK